MTVMLAARTTGNSFSSRPLTQGTHSPFAIALLGRYSLFAFVPTDQYCGGLASVKGPLTSIERPDTVENGQATDATFVSTDDGGSTFSTDSIATVNSLWTLECTSYLHCVALGDQGSLTDRMPGWAQGVMETTNDGGNTWTSDDLPSGFAVGAGPDDLSCADAQHCSVSGDITVPFKNPPACPSSYNRPFPSNPNFAVGVPDSALESIVQFESALITSANLQAKPGTQAFGCGWPPADSVSEIMSTSDGGSTWTPEEFPANAPLPRSRDCPVQLSTSVGPLDGTKQCNKFPEVRIQSSRSYSARMMTAQHGQPSHSTFLRSHRISRTLSATGSPASTVLRPMDV